MSNIQKLLLLVSVVLTALLAMVFFTEDKTVMNLFSKKASPSYVEASPQQDYSDNITGTWGWIAQDNSPQKNIIGMGTLDFVEDSHGNITGQIHSLSPANAAKKGANFKVRYVKTVIPIVKGNRLEGNKVTFQVKSYDQLVDNKVIIKNNGHSLFAKSAVNFLINGVEAPAEYRWTATRLSN